jgi:hypothetical protein
MLFTMRQWHIRISVQSPLAYVCDIGPGHIFSCYFTLMNSIFVIWFSQKVIYYELVSDVYLSAFIKKQKNWYVIWRSVYTDRWYRQGNRTDVTSGSWNQYMPGNATKGCFLMCSFFRRLNWSVRLLSYILSIQIRISGELRFLHLLTRYDPFNALQISFFRLALD